MAEKKAITREMRHRYKKATKAKKAVTLDELTALTGWTRSYASRAPDRAKTSESPSSSKRNRIFQQGLLAVTPTRVNRITALR